MHSKPTNEELEQRAWELEKSDFELKQAKEALRESEALFRNLFKRHAVAQLLIDPDSGNIIDANNAALEFYGWTQEQIQQKRIQDINILPPEEIKHEMEKARTKKRYLF
jgi:PAS domain-containing protein